MTQDQSRAISPLFRKVEGGWVFRAPNPWVFGRAQHYLANDAQRDAIYSALTPRRPALASAVVLGVLLSVIAIVIGTGMLIYGDADELPLVGVAGMFAAIFLLFYLALLVASRIRIRRLQPALAVVPTTDQRITSADMRGIITAAMPVKRLLTIAAAYALSCLASAVPLAITRNPLHPLISDTQSGMALFNNASPASLANTAAKPGRTKC